MKYFIDFEATQYSNEIISVGCVDENGRQFYSLVKPHSPGQLTSFITELTGIKRKDLEAAPTADEAFSAFFEWIDKSVTAEFFCYGNCDRHFVEKTMLYISSFTAQSALALVHCTLRDYSLDLARHYGIWQPVGLSKVYDHYVGEHVEQTHNSLDDAMCLKFVYENSINEIIRECPFPEYRIDQLKERSAKGNIGYTELKRGKVHAIRVSSGREFAFSSFGRAADWILAGKKQDPGDEKTKSNVCNRIIRAAKSDKPYYGCIWFTDSSDTSPDVTEPETAQA